MAAKPTTTKNKRQMVLLAALLVVLGYYTLHTFVFTGSSSKSNSNSRARTAPSATRSGSGTGSGESGSDESGASTSTKIQLLLDDRSPLELGLLVNHGGRPATLGTRGNIFDYFKEPPPPPVPLPPPPPIKISYLQPQTAIAGTPRPFKLSVSGSAFPPDAQILVNGGARPTKRINETTLTTDIAASEYSSARSFTIDVKSQADPQTLYSNQISFVVQPSPVPPFKYVGRIGDIAIIETGIKEFARLTRGSTIQGAWRIEAISDAGVDVIHTQYEIKARVAMQDKGR